MTNQPAIPDADSNKDSDVVSDRVINRGIEEEMKVSYLDYSMSVIVGRALPDVRDGLKPVHRRILFAMNNMGMHHNKPFKKSARIVGEVLGKYHPHGDIAVYDSLVRMAQTFSLRYPLIDGQGNFGSVDGDSPAAMRYTESRLKSLAEEMLVDINSDTVDFSANFDGSLEEPVVLPSKVPNLLINGSTGIAVGMATNIPPHNLKEVCSAVIALIDNPQANVSDLMQFIPAPDFPTGGIICGANGAREAYTTGRGKIIIRSRVEIEEKNRRQRLVITEIPYQVNKSELVKEIAELVREKKVAGIGDLRDESSRGVLRIVIELKQGVNPEILKNQLFAYSRLQESFGIIMLALDHNAPKVMNLRDLLEKFLEHRKEIIRRRTLFELRNAEAKAHILAGLIICSQNVNEIIKLIRASNTVDDARKGLMSLLSLSEKQSTAILEMRLQRLAALEQQKIISEFDETNKYIAELRHILSDMKFILEIIRKELVDVQKKFGDARRTQILDIDIDGVAEESSLIKPEDVVVTLSHAGYVKRLPLETYRAQRRGGKGIIGIETRDEDFVQDVFVANTSEFLLLFTNLGKVHWLRAFQVPESGRYALGTPLVNLIELSDDEIVTSLIPVKEFISDKFLFMVTANGIVKKTALEEFSNPRKGGIVAIGLEDKDRLISVLLTDNKQQIILATAHGLAVRFVESDVRVMGRTAQGVFGIRLRDGDAVIDGVVADVSKTLITLTGNGFGKRSPVEDYRLTNRGGVGVINLKLTDRNGFVVAVESVTDDDELVLISKKGITMRTPVAGISVIGRNTQGVRVMRLDDDDVLVSVAVIRDAGNGNSNGYGTNEKVSSVDAHE